MTTILTVRVSQNNHLSPIVGVGVMIIDESGQILLGSRIKSGEEPTWCFPGGKVEPHETLEQSAVREVFEETGLRLVESDIQPFTLFINKNLAWINSTVGLVYNLNDPILKNDIAVTEPDIFDQWSWFSLSNLPKNLFPASEAMINIWKKNALAAEWVSYPMGFIAE